MIKKFLFLIVSGLIIIACEKKDTDDYLTNGTWVLDNGLFSITKETLKFNSNGTYLIASELSIPRQMLVSRGNISGDYYRQGNLINFTRTVLELPNDTNIVTMNQYQSVNGQPLGSFFGYLYNGIRQKDSTLIDSTGSIRYFDLIKSGVFQHENSDIRTWIILSLTGDSLIVESNNIITKYYKN